MMYQENNAAGARISTRGAETNAAPRGFLALLRRVRNDMVHTRNDWAGTRLTTCGHETNTAPWRFLAVPTGPLGMTSRGWAGSP